MANGENYDMAGKKYNGLGMSKEICRKIFYDNAIKEFGEKPRKTDKAWTQKEIEELEVIYKYNEFKFNDLQMIKKYL